MVCGNTKMSLGERERKKLGHTQKRQVGSLDAKSKKQNTKTKLQDTGLEVPCLGLAPAHQAPLGAGAAACPARGGRSLPAPAPPPWLPPPWGSPLGQQAGTSSWAATWQSAGKHPPPEPPGTCPLGGWRKWPPVRSRESLDVTLAERVPEP